jgi:suppressor of G2 allele of SKP1
VKIELWLVKKLAARWGGLVGETVSGELGPKFLHALEESHSIGPIFSFTTVGTTAVQSRPTAAESSRPKKNWDILATEALEKEKDKTQSEDPNAGGDAAVNSLFQQIYADADEDTKRAMLKSYTESGGTSLSTDWQEVGKLIFLSNNCLRAHVSSCGFSRCRKGR